MDKLERIERMAKAIVTYLIKHEIPEYPLIPKEILEKYIQEAILEFEKTKEKCPKCGIPKDRCFCQEEEKEKQRMYLRKRLPRDWRK